jgi:hypothetical protein
MKLMRKELLPKNQAKDILLDLATMGYWFFYLNRV